MFEATVREGVCRLASPAARWLATGWDGGYATAEAAVNVSVPTDFERTDLAAYVRRRREQAAFEGTGPALLTGVDQRHARGARSGDVTVVATAGLSNPAVLPVGETPAPGAEQPERGEAGGAPGTNLDSAPPPGTVNLLVGAARSLGDGTLATLLSTAVEAKTATLAALTGFSGTTSDALAVGCDPAGESARFAGSATDLGAATRACVRDALVASLDSRYSDGDRPATVAEAEHGSLTRRAATTFRP